MVAKRWLSAEHAVVADIVFAIASAATSALLLISSISDGDFVNRNSCSNRLKSCQYQVNTWLKIRGIIAFKKSYLGDSM